MSSRFKAYKNMEKLRIAKYKEHEAYYAPSRYAPNNKQRYTDQEIQIILQHKLSDKEISHNIGRSVAAIQTIRCKYTKLRKDIAQ